MYIIYHFLFLIFAILSLGEIAAGISDRSKKIIIYFFSIIFVFLSTFYDGIRGDYLTYKTYFENITMSHLLNIFQNRFEYFYEVINVFVRQFTGDYLVLRFILAIIVMLIYIKIYLYDENGNDRTYPLTILFIVWCLNFGNILVIRSTIAIAICLYSVRHIINRDFRKFLFLTIIAFFFHQMSLAWIVSYFLYQLNFTRKIGYIGIAVALFLSPYIPELLLDFASLFGSNIYTRIYSYVVRGTTFTYGSNYDLVVTQMKAIANVAVLIILFELIKYINRKNNNENTEFDGLFNIYIFGTFLYIITLQCSMAITRVAIPFNDVQYFMLPEIFSLRYANKASKMIVFSVFFIYLMLRYIVNFLGIL